MLFMPSNPYAWFPDSNLKLHLAAANAIRKDPACIADVLKTLDHWMANGDDSSRFLVEWKKLLIGATHSSEGLDQLLALLADDSEQASQMKSYSPVVTILDYEAIDRVYESCTTSPTR